MHATDLKNLSYSGLVSLLSEMGEKPYRAKQLWKWMYQKHVKSFDEMTDLSTSLRNRLEKNCALINFKLVQKLISKDKSEKFLFELPDQNTIETVYMPSPDRITLCISTQVGCRMGCKFCLTTQQGLMRNLSAGEILNQVIEVQRAVDQKITNIVMMGMGEPLENLENVIQAIDILRSPDAFNLSQRKITVSTVGLVPAIEEFGKRTDVNLAISLNASTDLLRSQIIPINRKYPLQTLLDACRNYPLKPQRKITFEYVVFKDLNDSAEDIKNLGTMLKDIPCKINLIPFNEHKAGSFQRPLDQTVITMQDALKQNGINATIRYSRGRDILAACGQLASQSANLQ